MIEIIPEEKKMIPCDQFDIDANGKTVKTHSYYAVLCEKGGSEVKGIRLDGYATRTDVRDYLDCYDGWNVKAISRLYDEDFSEEGYIG